MHIDWKYVETPRTVNVPNDETNMEDANESIQMAIKQTQQWAKELKEELQTMQDSNTKFACFLNTDPCLVSLFYSIKARKAIA